MRIVKNNLLPLTSELKFCNNTFYRFIESKKCFLFREGSFKTNNSVIRIISAGQIYFYDFPGVDKKEINKKIKDYEKIVLETGLKCQELRGYRWTLLKFKTNRVRINKCYWQDVIFLFVIL